MGLVFAARGPETSFDVGRVRRPDPASSRIVGSMPSERLLVGADGRPAAGALGVLADNALGYSVAASLGGDAWSISTELWLDLLLPLDRDLGTVSAEARTLVPGAYSTGELTGPDGCVLALARERGRRTAQLSSEVLLEPPAGFRAAVADSVVEVLDLREDGDDALRMRVTEGLENPSQVLHGGISFCASEAVATWSRVAAGSDLATTSVHIVHARAVPSGSTISFRAETRHRGRSLWITDVTGVVDGRAHTHARVSAEAGSS